MVTLSTYFKEPIKPGERKLVTPGLYVSTITNIEVKATKKGDARLNIACLLHGRHDVQPDEDPELFAGKVVYCGLNLESASPVAMRITTETLGALFAACGFETMPDDTDDLKGKVVLAKITIKKASAEYPEGNEVSDFKQCPGLTQSSQHAPIADLPAPSMPSLPPMDFAPAPMPEPAPLAETVEEEPELAPAPTPTRAAAPPGFEWNADGRGLRPAGTLDPTAPKPRGRPKAPPVELAPAPMTPAPTQPVSGAAKPGPTWK